MININIPCSYYNSGHVCLYQTYHSQVTDDKSNKLYCSVFHLNFPEEHENIIQSMYTTQSKSLALLNINSPIISVRLVAKFILGLNCCPFQQRVSETIECHTKVPIETP
jgi:hypothetical protein